MTAIAASPLELDGRWRLHPQVALRPEPFGALLYHFGTRKLSFLKNPAVVSLVQSLPDHADVDDALRASGIDSAAMGPYRRALATLVASNMLVRDEETKL
ncbi:mycofactocin biosynthesis chaperone MftB [Antrihabitans stalactiti]|uniref:Mycofactocin biosynthesis chaperone MftB n=1 Tax=Antrihabitans stalactiti TaxID=2584121 RepID=A0A848KKW8_9NOCA|nr:mycofactocin biosynthesis chaperone MftB [Antrihabitans stalactiti]NMN98801.1 mycofactocin biosynthesis chaperone MftB [Antrihabitans stalactiti]